MSDTHIEHVEIDSSGRLIVRPALPPDQDFAFIYRAAMEVSWNPEERSLVAPPPREWSHFDWFRHLVSAVAQEYGERLVLSAATTWSGVSPELRDRIQQWSGGGRTSACS